MKIEAYEIIDHGIHHSQYFRGCGTSYTDYTHVATGIGDDFAEALEDALEQLAMSGYEVEHITGTGGKDTVDDRFEDDERWYYVSVRIREESK